MVRRHEQSDQEWFGARTLTPGAVADGNSETLRKSTYPLKLPNSIKATGGGPAREENVSLNQFIAAAVAEKVGVLRTTAAFLRERSGNAKPKDLLRYVRPAPKVPPVARDELT